MSSLDDLTDEQVLEKMEECVAIRFHSKFEALEDVLWQRYVEFDIETFPIPFAQHREKMAEAIPEDIRERYFEIRSRVYPGISR